MQLATLGRRNLHVLTFYKSPQRFQYNINPVFKFMYKYLGVIIVVN